MDVPFERLNEAACKWTPEGFAYAPYFAVVNSSIMGKCRMLTELAEYGNFVVIVCLREDPDPALQPPRAIPQSCSS